MPYLLSPICNEQQSDSNGAPLSGGTIETYQAGTSTPASTYTGADGSALHTNPIVLNSSGLPPAVIWLDSTLTYKLIIKDSNGVVQRTIDNIAGITTSAAPIQDQWVAYTGSITYISATSFSMTGDQSSTFHVGRRVRSVNTGGVVYSTISVSSYSAGVTTVTLVNDGSGVLDTGLSSVSYGLISATGTSYAPIPPGTVMLFFQAAAPAGWTQVTTHNNKSLRVVSGTGAGTGGSVAFTSAFTSQAVTGSNSATTLTTAQIPPHTHMVGDAGGANVAAGGNPIVTGSPIDTVSGDGSAQGLGGGSHNHTFTGTAINLAVQYIDIILASKN